MRAQRLALDERHCIEGKAVRLAGRQHRNDVRLLQPGHRTDLALEPVRAQPLRQLRRQHLHNHPTAEPSLLGEKDTTHPPATELSLDEVGVAEGLLQLGEERSAHGGNCCA
jgi:hypothetical protein